MDIAQHLFISDSGRLLDSWRQAFMSAQGLSWDQLAAIDAKPGMVWLRLSGAATVAQQIAAVRAHFEAAPLIVMSDVPGDLEALAVFSVGARGYCNAHAGEEVLRNVAGVVGQGGLWIGESIMQRLLSAPPLVTPLRAAGTETWAVDLTEREREVARIVTLGRSNLEIAAQLGITERTVKAHVGAVLEKLRLKNRLQLTLLVKDS